MILSITSQRKMFILSNTVCVMHILIQGEYNCKHTHRNSWPTLLMLYLPKESISILMKTVLYKLPNLYLPFNTIIREFICYLILLRVDLSLSLRIINQTGDLDR